MANRPAVIRQADVKRVVRGAQAAGLTITRVELGDGKLVVYTEELATPDTPLDEWRRKNGSGKN